MIKVIKNIYVIFNKYISIEIFFCFDFIQFFRKDCLIVFEFGLMFDVIKFFYYIIEIMYIDINNSIKMVIMLLFFVL